ncbi:MAG: macro domain-containing protein, partial [Oscillospiraceae bacterium]|nr:macro domain-containing protein [Oscillospiraceae bacterium]
MSWICIEKAGITDKSVDAIVNAANERLQAGSGVCGAIFRAAGYEELQRACDAIGHCDTGSAVITPGFKSKARLIIHAVGPIWHGGKNGEAEKLYGAYYSSLTLAKENGVHYICFPLISTGVYGYPVDEAWDVSLRACIDFIAEEKDYNISIFFAVPDEAKYEMVFVNRFGTPNPNHTWGFGSASRAFTRSENANANEWADPNKAYGGLNVPPKLTDEQIAIVKKYF